MDAHPRVPRARHAGGEHSWLFRNLVQNIFGHPGGSCEWSSASRAGLTPQDVWVANARGQTVAGVQHGWA